MPSEQDSREVVEGLLRRPFWRDLPLPVLVLTGAQAGAAGRLSERFNGLLPYAKPEEGAHKSLAELVEALAGASGAFGGNKVGRTLLPAPRFPLTEFVLWARAQRDKKPEQWPEDKWPPQPESRPGQEELKRRFGARFGVRPSLQADSRKRWAAGDFLVRAAIFFVPVATVAAWWLDTGITDLIPLAPGLLALLLGTGAIGLQAVRFIRGTAFSRWFRRHQYEGLRRTVSQSRPEYTLLLMNASEPEIEKLLVYAMLEDLRQAYRKWPRIPWPSWGRGLYALLVLDAEDPVHARFLRVLDEVRYETGIVPPLLVIAEDPGQPEPAGPPARREQRSIAKEVDDWRSRVALRGPEPRLRLAGDKLVLTGTYRPRLARVKARAVGYWLAMLALLLAPPLYVYGSNWFGCGPGMMRAEQQCVGLSDNLAEIAPDPALVPILERIKQQNEAIDTRQRVITVFYLGVLTTAHPGDDQTGGSAGELSGIAARQGAYNRLGSWQIKVEVANTGQYFRHARFAAAMIRQRAAGDPDVAGVIGLAWSRTETQDAIRVLSDAHIPMLSTTNSADRTPLVYHDRPSPYFFRMAAPNSAQARAFEFWLARGLPGGRPVAPQRVAVLVEHDVEEHELYSKDLAEGLAKGPYAAAKQYRFANQDELASKVDLACQDGAEVLLYTGRATFLNTVADTREHQCAAKVQILAGDDVTEKLGQLLVKEDFPNKPAISFVALNDVRKGQGDNRTQTEIENWIASVKATGVSRVHAWMGYDALLAVTSAINKIKASDVDESVNIAESVAYNLRGLGVGGLIQGASGKFYFSEDAESHAALPRGLWLFSTDPAAGASENGLVPRGSCTVDEKAPDTAELEVKCSFG
ncbi:ABC transporter substrate-binding protein [Nonomuraea sp. NPDC050153]|uniref:ABC transporter substrate-binding protein n=1 Tax=Nonomuraea sp. NPDC050153 TaxID=3364359 RepID=UPI0037AE2947